ncbi:hypothetical protein EWI07_11960 [Sporolactobacillus sp. THM7-4]|nr:hypothetical protein EWI07_11960 [Sporolactobacillus sp. THM7-4]
MSRQTCYEKCCLFINQGVEIKCSDGVVHHGIIESVDHEKVYLRLFGNPESMPETRNPGTFIYGPGPGAFLGGVAGSLLGIGLSTIIGVRPYPYPYSSYGPYGYPYGPRPPYGGFYGPGAYY